MDNKNITILVLIGIIFSLFLLNRCNKPHPIDPVIVTKTTIKTDTIYVKTPPVTVTEYIRISPREQQFTSGRDTIITYADCQVDSIIIKGEDKIIENTITIENTIKQRQLHHLMVGGDINTRLDIGLEVLYVYNKIGVKIGVDYLPHHNQFAPKVGLVWKIK